MIDMTRPIPLSQEPSTLAQTFLQGYHALSIRRRRWEVSWMLVLPPACTVTVMCSYRGMTQREIMFPDQTRFLLCSNRHPYTHQEYHTIVFPLGQNRLTPEHGQPEGSTERFQKEHTMSLTYHIDPLLPPFTNGAVFSTRMHAPSATSKETSVTQERSSFEVFFVGTNVSPQWNQEAELVLQRLMICQGTTRQRCAAWVCEPEQWLFDPSLIDYRSQERVQQGLPPLHHIPESEAFSILTRMIDQAIKHMAPEIMTREKEATAGLFSPQALVGKRRLLSLLQTTKDLLAQRGENHHQA